MDTPVIYINGKKIKARTPKARMWYDLVRFEEDIQAAENPAEKCAELIASNFEGLTVDEVLDNLDVNKLMPTIRELGAWVFYLVNAKLQEIPNAQSQDSE